MALRDRARRRISEGTAAHLYHEKKKKQNVRRRCFLTVSPRLQFGVRVDKPMVPEKTFGPFAPQTFGRLFPTVIPVFNNL